MDTIAAPGLSYLGDEDTRGAGPISSAHATGSRNCTIAAPSRSRRKTVQLRSVSRLFGIASIAAISRVGPLATPGGSKVTPMRSSTKRAIPACLVGIIERRDTFSIALAPDDPTMIDNIAILESGQAQFHGFRPWRDDCALGCRRIAAATTMIEVCVPAPSARCSSGWKPLSGPAHPRRRARIAVPADARHRNGVRIGYLWRDGAVASAGMLTRRRVLETAGASVMTRSFFDQQAAAALASNPPLRFGVVADPQYAPAPPAMNRYYANSLWKLAEAVDAFNADADLHFVVTLGDIIDRHWESFGHILPIYDRLRHPNLFVLGNHDFEVAPDFLASVPRVLGLERRFFDFAAGGIRFIVVDGNDLSLFAHPTGSPNSRIAAETLRAMKERGEVNAKEWNGGLGEAQYAWLEATMNRAEVAGERIIVLGHYPVYPKTTHSMWGAERFVELVCARPSFLAYFDGHDHAGNYGTVAGKHFVNFKGMVETATDTAYAIVTVRPDRIEIEGFGTEPSRNLAVGTLVPR
jgi:hypothetical protein